MVEVLAVVTNDLDMTIEDEELPEFVEKWGAQRNEVGETV